MYLDRFIGELYIKVCDKISTYADIHGNTILVREPTDFNIDVEPERLNIWLDIEGRVDHFTIG